MNQITHPELVAALAKSGTDIYDDLTDQHADLWHHATGIAGECGELLEALIDFPVSCDRENIVEEMGDLEFYFEGMRQNLDIAPYETKPVPGQNEHLGNSLLVNAARLTISGTNLLDLAKKVAIYQKDADRTVFAREMLRFEEFLEAIRIALYITREETIEGNIAKLSVRYAAGSYSNQQAQDRADKVDA